MDKVVAILKLVSGEELISEVVVTQTDVPGQEIVQLVRPCLVERDVTEDGRINARFTPLAVYFENHTITVSNLHIVYTGSPEPGFRQAYLDLLGPQSEAGLSLPEEKKLILPQ